MLLDLFTYHMRLLKYVLGEEKARTDTETPCFYLVDHVRTIWG